MKGSVDCVSGLLTCETKNSWLATFRGRVGYAFDRWLPYVTGGGAYGNVKATARHPAASVLGTASKNQLGWTVGARPRIRLPRQLDGQDRISLRRSRQFRRRRLAPIANNVSFKENIVRAGLNYKFSGPIFSRY